MFWCVINIFAVNIAQHGVVLNRIESVVCTSRTFCRCFPLGALHSPDRKLKKFWTTQSSCDTARRCCFTCPTKTLFLAIFWDPPRCLKLNIVEICQGHSQRVAPIPGSVGLLSLQFLFPFADGGSILFKKGRTSIWCVKQPLGFAYNNMNKWWNDHEISWLADMSSIISFIHWYYDV